MLNPKKCLFSGLNGILNPRLFVISEPLENAHYKKIHLLNCKIVLDINKKVYFLLSIITFYNSFMLRNCCQWVL